LTYTNNYDKFDNQDLFDKLRIPSKKATKKQRRGRTLTDEKKKKDVLRTLLDHIVKQSTKLAHLQKDYPYANTMYQNSAIQCLTIVLDESDLESSELALVIEKLEEAKTALPKNAQSHLRVFDFIISKANEQKASPPEEKFLPPHHVLWNFISSMTEFVGACLYSSAEERAKEVILIITAYSTALQKMDIPPDAVPGLLDKAKALVEEVNSDVRYTVPYNGRVLTTLALLCDKLQQRLAN